MIATIAAIFCGAYILGLLLTGVPGDIAGIPLAAIGMLLLGIPVAFLIRLVWRMAPKPQVWLIASLISIAAILYFQIRLPQPSPTDISQTDIFQTVEPAITSSEKPASTSVTEKVTGKVTGKVITSPRLTRSGRLQFELAATQIELEQPDGRHSPQTQAPPEPVTGKVYVTVPPTAGEQLYPGLTVQISGSLYKPKPASNPGGFDFEKYLAQQGIFTGLSGKTLRYPSSRKPEPPLFWSIRQQIRQVQDIGLGQPAGALVSAMVMGKSAVDLPYAIQDQFKQTGLAHALAASGTQVSLLIGVMLVLMQRLPGALQCGLGTAVLIAYLGLTGLEPSVLRAGIMGFVALLALTIERKIKPVGSLLLAATLLLLHNPLWIWDLGFQLSFLATLGLLVTVPILTKWLDGLPTLFASMIAIPIAAYLWTLPLMLSLFGIVSPYSILVNLLVSPLIAVLSIGGMVSAVGALLYPTIGSALAGLLYLPAHLLLRIAEFGSQLPGNTFAVGTINSIQVLLLYGLIVLIWRWQRLQKYWWLAGLISVGLVIVPVGYAAANRAQITVLATNHEPVVVVQDHGSTGLIHSGNAEDVQFSVLPFLRQQGINHLDWAIAPELKPVSMTGWQQIVTAAPIKLFYSSLDPALPPSSAFPDTHQTYQDLLAEIQATSGVAIPLTGQPIHQGTVTLVWLRSADATLKALQLQMGEHTWLLFSQLPDWKHQTSLTQSLPPATAIGWSGKALSFQLLEHLDPKIAIAFKSLSNPQTETWLQQHQVQVHAVAQQGAFQWQPR